MSDLQDGDDTVRADDDTSVGAVTQGGHTERRGHSLVWFVAVLVVLAAVALAWATAKRPKAPAENGATPVSSAPASGTPSGR